MTPANGWYVAIPLAQECMDAFRALVDRAARLPDVRRLQDPDTAHITLRYFGTLGDSEQRELHETLVMCARDFSPFSAQLDTLATFGPPEEPRTLVVRVAAHPMLLRLAGMCGELPFGEDGTAFVPHLTVARFHPRCDAQAIQAFCTEPTGLPASMPVDRIASYAAPTRLQTQVRQGLVILGADEASGRI